MTGRKAKHAKIPQLFTKENPLCHGQLKFYIGAKIEALDSKKWYQARIVNINTLNLKVLVHFEGWNSRHDKWFEHTNESLRPLLSGDQKQQEGYKRKELQPGDKVLARWSDSKYYPAKINAPVNEKIYEVIFYDGFKKRLNKNCIRPDPKRTFEAFEAKFKENPASGMPRDGSVSGTPSSVCPPSSKINRTKRRHAEPSTMADFVTIIPKKRFKHRFSGTPSDSDEFSGYNDHWENRSKESHLQNQEPNTSSPMKISTKNRLKRKGQESSVSANNTDTPSADSSYQEAHFDDLGDQMCWSSPSESSVSPIRKSFSGLTEYNKKTLKKKKKLGGNFLKIKLPLDVPRKKKRGRKRKVFSSIEKGDAQIDHQQKSEEFKQKINASSYSEVSYTGEERVPNDEQSRKGEGNEAFIVAINANEYQGKIAEREHRIKELNERPTDGAVDGAGSKLNLKQKRPRGRPKMSKNRRKSEPATAFDSQTRLPRRERKLTEKGLELLQSIGSKRGVDGLLKESYIHAEAEQQPTMSSSQGDSNTQDHESNKVTIDDSNSKEATSLMVRISPFKVNRFPSETKKGTDPSGPLGISPTKTKPFDAAEDVVIESKEKSVEELEEPEDQFRDKPIIGKVTGLESSSENIVKEKSSWGRESTEAKSDVIEKAGTSKDDDVDEQYSDTYSEGSGNLVIDVDDDLSAKALADRDEPSLATGKQNEDQDGSAACQTNASAKPRTFPRLKYTLSHEERKGNRLAKRKKIRSKLKSRIEKRIETVKKATEKEQKLSSTASPLESLTKMVSEKADSIGFPSQPDDSAVEEAVKTGIHSEEGMLEGKPTKGFKQQRGPYKSRLKMEGSFLSMVHQDRPSQVERPVCSKLVKEKLPRGRPRSRNLNRPEAGCTDGSIKNEETRNTPGESKDLLKEPLDFSASTSERHDKSSSSKPQTNLSTQGLMPVQQEVFQVPAYGPQHFIPYTGPHGNFVGPPPRHLPPGHVQPRHILPFQGPNTQLPPPHGVPVIKSEPLGFEMIRGAQGMVPYRGMIGLTEIRTPPPEYGVLNPLQPVMNPHFTTGPVSFGYSTECIRFQGPGMQNAGPYKGEIRECPCQECRNFTSRPMDVRMDKQRKSGDIASPVISKQSPAPEYVENVNRESPMTSEQSKGVEQDKEPIITGVYSLRDSNAVSAIQSKASNSELAEKDISQSEETNDELARSTPETKEPFIDLNQTVARKDDITDVETESKDAAKTSEGTQVTPKPKEFESKKKRLDFITGKLSAQKQNVKARTQDSADKTNDLPGTDTNIAEAEASGINRTQETDDAASSVNNKHLAVQTPPDYAMKQTQLVFNATLEPHGSAANTAGSAISQDGHMITTFPYQTIPMDPRVSFQTPEFAPHMQPIYNQSHGLPHSGYQPHLRSMPYVNYSRFPSAPPFPYGPPRYIAAPGYYIPRESLQNMTSHFPPPYGSFPVSSASQRFPVMGPGEILPAVVCKTPNCSCPLPHAAPPIQIAPKAARMSPSRGQSPDQGMDPTKPKTLQTPTVNQSVPTSPQRSQKKKDTLMMGDPRRLTLPLQRTKKLGVKHDKGRDSVVHGKPNEDQKSTNEEVDEERVSASSGAGINDEESNGFGEADEEGKENSPFDQQANGDNLNSRNSNENLKASSKKIEKSLSKEKVLAPKEFTVELDLNEFQCQHKGCSKSFRKASSRDYHQKYFHTPRVPQKKRKLSSCLPSPISSDALLSPGGSFLHSKSYRNLSSTDGDLKTPEDMASVRSGYTSSVMTDENLSDREKHDDMSDEDSDESDSDTDGSACVDDIIKCKCGDLEEQGFMIQCEQCFTWQHGDCVNLSIQSVPKKYLCYICTNPEGLRSCYKFKNNFDWFKKGTLPSLIETEDKNQEKIANIMQASHALMEDVANIFDVINGIKKKLTLLNKPSDPSLLQFWRKFEEKVDKIEDGNDQSFDENKIESKEMKETVECDKRIENGTVDLDKRASNSFTEKNSVIENGKSNEVPNGEDLLKENDLKNTDNEIDIAEKENPDIGKERIQDIKGIEKDCKDTTDLVQKDSECTQIMEPRETTDEKEIKDRNDELDMVYTKLNLLNHVDEIEVQLSKRMDEIESNLDVLEQNYSQVEGEIEDGQAKSSFKIVFPDMASIARHLNMINRQLIDAK